MSFLMAFLAAALTTLLTGAFARFMAGHFTVYSRPGSIAFCLAAGFAGGRYGAGGSINRETMIEVAAAGGAALALVILYWLLVRRTRGEPY